VDTGLLVLYTGAMADDRQTIAAALRAELDLKEESAYAFASRAGLHRQTVCNLLNGHDCTGRILKKLEAATNGRIGLHSFAAAE